MVNPKDWKEFRESGLLWLINSILHVFGWVIIYDIKTDGNVNVYPARTSYRGFTEEINTNGYRKIAKYIKNNNDEIYKEAMEE